MSTGAPGDAYVRAGQTRAATAAQKRHIDRDSAASRTDAALAMPRERTTTEAQRQEYERIRAELGADAARCAARQVMLRAHGCTGEACRHPGHDGDREALHEVLKVLGLEDPGWQWQNHGIRGKTARKVVRGEVL